MSSADRFFTLLAAVVAVGSGLGGTLVWVARKLWDVKGAWDQTNADLRGLMASVAELVTRKDRDHERIGDRIDRVEGRQDRHEAWHAEHGGA